MSSPINFQSDAMECLRMADRTKGDEDRTVLVDLARAWILLGEQFEGLHHKDIPDALEPGPLSQH
jgi:hypothetical protein